MSGGSRKISSCNVGLHNVALPGGQNLKIGQHSGTPRGRRHATTSANLLVVTCEGGVTCARGGGGCIAIMRGGEVRATYFEELSQDPGVKAATDVELGSFIFV